MGGVTWTIRPEPIDSPEAVAALRAYAAELESRRRGRPATEQEIAAALAEHPGHGLVPPDGHLLLARTEADGTVAGCAAVLMIARATAEIRGVWVAPAARRGGLGGLLVAAAECAALGMGARAVRSDTRRDLVEAERLYARRGYVEIEPFDDSPYAHHRLGKPLRPTLTRIPPQASSPE